MRSNLRHSNRLNSLFPTMLLYCHPTTATFFAKLILYRCSLNTQPITVNFTPFEPSQLALSNDTQHCHPTTATRPPPQKNHTSSHITSVLPQYPTNHHKFTTIRTAWILLFPTLLLTATQPLPHATIALSTATLSIPNQSNSNFPH
jgi:hypothetical protein